MGFGLDAGIDDDAAPQKGDIVGKVLRDELGWAALGSWDRLNGFQAKVWFRWGG